MLEDVYLIRYNHIWNRYLFNAMNKIISVKQRKRYQLNKENDKVYGKCICSFKYIMFCYFRKNNTKLAVRNINLRSTHILFVNQF